MSLDMIRSIVQQAKKVKSVKTIYFEGGEPFLYFPILVEGARHARRNGFDVGIVTNGYWGVTVDDAKLWLEELKRIGICDLSISSDNLHEYDEDKNSSRAFEAAKELGLPVSVLETRLPSKDSKGDVVFRGRAAKNLAKDYRTVKWSELSECPESLASPGRVHIDSLGWVHVCQGIAVGNICIKPLASIVKSYRPAADPIIGPLIRGGPAELARVHRVRRRQTYADGCELCYECRVKLQEEYSDTLVPDQMYGTYR